MQLTYRFRLKDTCDSELRRQARAVNTVWNYCNETQQIAVKRNRKWLSGYDLTNLTSGSSKELDVHAHTIQHVCKKYATSREIAKKPWLRWRSNKKSLGWVPFAQGTVTLKDGCFKFRGQLYKFWSSRELNENMFFGAGSFSQDSEGHWYINFLINVKDTKTAGTDAVGIDLGLKDLASMSDGSKIEHPHWYRNMAKRIATAQRAKKKKQVKKLHAKVKNQRKDFLHKASTKLVNQHGAIFVGNVKPSTIAKTRMAKSSLDAGWASFKTMLEYKCNRADVVYVEVNEAFTTQTCSSCGNKKGPKGVAGLGIREWSCSCGAIHDRDTNAAQNILARGLASLAVGATA